jgi:hypothetical protein
MPIGRLHQIKILKRGRDGERVEMAINARDYGELALHADIMTPSWTSLTHVRSGRQIYRGSWDNCEALLTLLLVRKLNWNFRHVKELGTIGRERLREQIDILTRAL